ncbi:MAG: hypothetical protein K0R46_1236 [Herbinix sp.]|nr:hypothetical protein [Herbinix sp.]
MKEIEEELKKNPMKTREDVIGALLMMCRPLKDKFSTSKSYLYLGDTGAHFGDKSARMEGFSRVLWGIGPLLSQDIKELPSSIQEEVEEYYNIYLEGLIHGTDPEHEGYWGELQDFDQMMVEMAALVTAISLNPDKLWKNLQDNERSNLYQWLDQINVRKVHPNNWRFFRILVNMTFRKLGLPWNEDNLEDDLQIIENCYTGEGWYYDGNAGQVDYYIPFAMHFYSLIYAQMMEQEDPQRAFTFKSRSAVFAKDFIYWFGKDGSEIPFGRSLTYRFAHVAFFAALAFSNTEGLPLGIIKGVFLKNLRHWFSKPIFDPAGHLSIGYEYPNLIMSERYNSPGSPYWAFKAFLILALKPDHPFWQAKESEYEYEPLKLQKHPHMLIAHDNRTDHVVAFTTGQHCANHGNSAAKYEKFVYSNRFGFSVNRGTGLEDGAFDSTLAVSRAGENFYRMRYGASSFSVEKDHLRMRYEILPQVQVESIIVPLMPWHVRIHQITTGIAIDVADGGFAISTQSDQVQVSEKDYIKCSDKDILNEDDCLIAILPWGTSGVVTACGGELQMIRTFPNTNLFVNLAMVPTLKKRLEAGNHTLISMFVAGGHEVDDKVVKERPVVELSEETVTIRYREMMISIDR